MNVHIIRLINHLVEIHSGEMSSEADQPTPNDYRIAGGICVEVVGLGVNGYYKRKL